MNPRERNEKANRIESSHGIRFIYEDNLPEIPLYTVPSVYLFAEVVSGGHLGRFPAVETISNAVCYFRDFKCYLVAPDMKSFLSDPCWKDRAVACSLIEVFRSREHASQHHDIVLASTLPNELHPKK